LGQLLALLLVEEEEGDDLEHEDAGHDEEPALARLGRRAAGAALLRKEIYPDHTRLSRSFRIASPSATENCATRVRRSSWLTSLASTLMRSIGWSTSAATRERRAQGGAPPRGVGPAPGGGMP